MSAFALGDFTLHSGERSSWKIDCDALTFGDLVTISHLLAERVPPFSQVESIPSGGDRLAEMMVRHRTSDSRNTLVVDDVWTTGGSMLAALANRPYTYGAAIFNRGRIRDGRVTALFTFGVEDLLRPLHEARTGRLIDEADALAYKRAVYTEVAELDVWSTCHDCAVVPGRPHVDGCDTARCTVCGWQRIGCEHDGQDVGWGEVWTGVWPGSLEVAEGLADDLNDLASKAMQGLLAWNGWRWVK